MHQTTLQCKKGRPTEVLNPLLAADLTDRHSAGCATDHWGFFHGQPKTCSPITVALVKASDLNSNSCRNFRSWHLAEVPPAMTNVGFEGKNGHDADATRMSAT